MNIGFIDYYLDEWHANNYPRFIEEKSGGRMKVTRAYAQIDSPIGGRSTEAWCRDMDIPRAASIDEICEECDAIIVLSPDNCEMHEALCQKLAKIRRLYGTGAWWVSTSFWNKRSGRSGICTISALFAAIIMPVG